MHPVMENNVVSWILNAVNFLTLRGDVSTVGAALTRLFNARKLLPSVYTFNFSQLVRRQTLTQWSYIVVHCLMFQYVVILSVHEDV